MIRILLFVFISSILLSCKTASLVRSEDHWQLDIAQNQQKILPDSSFEENNSPAELISSNDSAVFSNFKQSIKHNQNLTNKNLEFNPYFGNTKKKAYRTQIQPVEEPSSSAGVRIFIPMVMLALSIFILLNFPVLGLGLVAIAFSVLVFLLLHTNIFKLSKSDKKGKSKRWQILVSIIALLASIAFVILAPTETFAFIGIVFIAIALMVLIFSIINNLIRTQSKPTISKQEKRKSPYNRWAILAGISLLIFLISIAVGYFIFVPYLYTVIFFSFLSAFFFSIIALVNMSRKSHYERGKVLSKVVLIISSIPVIAILSYYMAYLFDLD